ncbi:MAG: class I SAM-dependent methyltransferase [Candidatus Dojkabacteria bacterium]
MSKYLQDIYKIQSALTDSGYNDISRISNEIYTYSTEQKVPLENIITRIEKGEPWEYIIGEVEFCENKFLVNKATLIPRVETEQLVDIAYKEYRKNKKYSQIIDVGTGTGCIIISLFKKINPQPKTKFYATDISSSALDLAKENARINGIKDEIEFKKTNIVEGIEMNGDILITANLPYIPLMQYMKLDKSVLDYEPKLTLEGGIDGLKYYKKLLKQVEKKVKDNGNISMIIEIEPSTLPELKKVLSKYKYKVIKDFRKKNRFLLIHLY